MLNYIRDSKAGKYVSFLSSVLALNATIDGASLNSYPQETITVTKKNKSYVIEADQIDIFEIITGIRKGLIEVRPALTKSGYTLYKEDGFERDPGKNYLDLWWAIKNSDVDPKDGVVTDGEPEALLDKVVKNKLREL